MCSIYFVELYRVKLFADYILVIVHNSWMNCRKYKRFNLIMIHHNTVHNKGHPEIEKNEKCVSRQVKLEINIELKEWFIQSVIKIYSFLPAYDKIAMKRLQEQAHYNVPGHVNELHHNRCNC